MTVVTHVHIFSAFTYTRGQFSAKKAPPEQGATERAHDQRPAGDGGAMIHPKPEKLKRDGSSVSEQHHIPKGKLSEACTILQYAPAGSFERWGSATILNS